MLHWEASGLGVGGTTVNEVSRPSADWMRHIYIMEAYLLDLSQLIIDVNLTYKILS